MRGEKGIKRSVFYKTAPYSGGLLKKANEPLVKGIMKCAHLQYRKANKALWVR